MKKNGFKRANENMSPTEVLLWENEIKTNKICGRSTLAVTLLIVLFDIPIIFNWVDTKFAWAGWVLLGCCLLEIFLLVLLKIIGYNDKRAKYLALVGLLSISGIAFFFYPLSAVFLFGGPILVSIKYYNPKMTAIFSVFNWIIFILAIVANVSLDAVSLEVHNLHIEQGMVLWEDISYTVKYYALPISMVFLIEGIMACHIAGAGSKMVIKQADISAKAAILSSEINTASKIQNSSLAPSDFVSPDGRMALSAGIKTARDVGGDFYDYFMVDDHLLVVAVADVSDKGLPAAMYAVEAQSYLRFAFFECFHKKADGKAEYIDLEKAVNSVNRQLSRYNMDGMFVTMWVGCFDTRSGAGKYINAGHNPPYIIHADGSITSVENDPQFFMGAFEDANLKTGFLRLGNGDILALYTDGATDARNKDDEVFGGERLKIALSVTDGNNGRKEPSNIKNAVFNTLNEYIGGAEQYDDITLLSLLYCGEEEEKKYETELEADETSASKVMDFVHNGIAPYDCPEIIRKNLDVIIDEICSNISDYAYKGDDGHLKVGVCIGVNYIILRFEDEGIMFNPLLSSLPDDKNELSVGGLGIHFVKNLSDDMKYRYENGKNILTVYKIWNM